MSASDTYYRDHWVDIDQERLDAYEELFVWEPRMAPLLEAAEFAPGQCVVDFGCGPAGTAVEIARRVAPGGVVHGVDLNAELLARAEARAEREGVSLTLHHSTDESIPLPAGSADRVFCKNVLEYVSDPAATLREFRRVLAPGGRIHVIDSDWGLLTVEPLGTERLRALFDAARLAYRTPEIGRRLYGLFRGAGLSEIKVRVLTTADTTGRFAPVLANMAKYARDTGRMGAAEIDRLEAEVRSAIEDQTFLMLLPQFVVTGQL